MRLVTPLSPPRSSKTVAFFGRPSTDRSPAASYCRGVLKALSRRGYDITIFEPGADRQGRGDVPDPTWASLVVYPATETGVKGALAQAAEADVVLKASAVGAFDRWLEAEIPRSRTGAGRVVFWDVDVTATLERLEADPTDAFRDEIPRYDAILTQGGGERVVNRYRTLGALRCLPVYDAVDPDVHHSVAPDPRWASDLTFLGDRRADNEALLEELFFSVARRMPDRSLILGGEGWNPTALPANVRYVGQLDPADHNAANASARASLNVHGTSVARYGTPPANRLFQAGAAGACIISDACDGIGQFLEPPTEILLATRGTDVEQHLFALTFERAHIIGHRARRRILVRHTYDRRAADVDKLLRELSRTTPGPAPRRRADLIRADFRHLARMGLR